MATIRLVPNAYTLSSTSYLTISNAENMYANTDSTTYGQVTHNRNSTTAYYLYLHNFNFSDVPSNANVSSFTIKLRGLESALSTNSSYRMSLYNNNTSISNTTVSSSLSTTATTFTFPNGSLTWSQLSGYGNDFRIRVPLRRNQQNTSGYVRIYGAEISVEYTASTVHVTGVSLDKHSVSIEEGSTETLTETVSPANATDKSVSWSTSNSSVATVNSSGVVTAVSAGTARITVTTTDGSYTDYCDVTVTAPSYTQYRQTDTMTAGKNYLIANGNSGSVYLLTNEANGSRTLKGVSATVQNGIISVTASTEAKALFTAVRYTPGNDVTITISKNSQYLYCDNANGLRMNAPATLDRFWHYKDNKFWQFKSSASDGYSDNSSEFKYYLTWNNGNATDSHVDTTSIEDSNIPRTYFFEEYVPSDEALYVKENGSWVEVQTAYKKINGSWVEQSDLSTVFQSGTKYVHG